VEYRRLGTTGLRISRLGLGCGNFGGVGSAPAFYGMGESEDEAFSLMDRAWEAGINFFDTADVYTGGESEKVTGKTLWKLASRDSIVLATKVFNPMGPGPNDKGLSRKHILSAIDASLQRLGTDYVDLYQIHRWDYDTPIEETMEALHDVVKSGKARYIGASSMYAWQFANAQYAAERHGWTPFVSMQPHYNLLYREEEREMIPFCIDQKLAIIPWSPLARGLLTGKRTRERTETERARTDAFGKTLYNRDDDFEIIRRVDSLAEKKGIPAAQIALAWMLTKPAVTAPIIGASKPGHLEDAVAALSVTLSPEEVADLEAPYQPHPVLGHS
jgi:aryl-alcohol dehydrogenase-like predicted oxidoreductase